MSLIRETLIWQPRVLMQVAGEGCSRVAIQGLRLVHGDAGLSVSVLARDLGLVLLRASWGRLVWQLPTKPPLTKCASTSKKFSHQKARRLLCTGLSHLARKSLSPAISFPFLLFPFPLSILSTPAIYPIVGGQLFLSPLGIFWL